MQTLKTRILDRTFWLQTVLPCLLALAAAFIARYQLELSDGVTADYMAGQWPVFAPLNALTAFCLTLVLFALLGKWSRATGIAGAIFTVLSIANYYTRDLHGSALMPQDVLNIGTAAEVMGSYTLRINQTVITLALLYLPVLAMAALQAWLVRPRKGVKISWKRRGIRYAASLVCAALILYIGYFSPAPIKPKAGPGRRPTTSTAIWPAPLRRRLCWWTPSSCPTATPTTPRRRLPPWARITSALPPRWMPTNTPMSS